MSDWSWIHDMEKRLLVRRFAEEWKMGIHAHRGLVVRDLMAKEFESLLSYISGSHHQSFEDLPAIAADFYMLDSRIVDEIRKPAPCGTSPHSMHHEQTIADLENLRIIVRCIAHFHKLAQGLELQLPRLPLPPRP